MNNLNVADIIIPKIAEMLGFDYQKFLLDKKQLNERYKLKEVQPILWTSLLKVQNQENLLRFPKDKNFLKYILPELMKSDTIFYCYKIAGPLGERVATEKKIEDIIDNAFTYTEYYLCDQEMHWTLVITHDNFGLLKVKDPKCYEHLLRNYPSKKLRNREDFFTPNTNTKEFLFYK